MPILKNSLFRTAPMSMALLCTVVPWHVHAQNMVGSHIASADTVARMSKVVVYPGAATIERTARITPTQRSIALTCLPDGLDANAIQIQADDGVKIGDISLRSQPRLAVPACASPLESRIRELEDQLAALQAETTGLELGNKYLQSQAQAGSHAEAKLGTAPSMITPNQLQSMAQALQRNAQESAQRLHTLQRQSEAINRTLQPLRDERDRTNHEGGNITTLTVQVATERAASVHILYTLSGPGWQPSYRARLNPDTAQIQLERQALVAQNTGEDWSDISLVLSTGRPNQATQGPLPRPWTLDLAPPLRKVSAPADMDGLPAAPAAAPAPAPMAMSRPREENKSAAMEMPNFDVSSLDRAYTTEFVVPQRISVPSSGQRVTLSLGQQQIQATLRSRTTPALEAAAYLVASITPPPGVWPAGPITLYREGTLVGKNRLDFASATHTSAAGKPAETTLSFGRDEKVMVIAEPEITNTSTTGLTHSGTERIVVKTYRIENRHSKPVALEVLDMAPVARNEAIEVQSRYTPAPTTAAWNNQPGLLAWEHNLVAGGSVIFTAQHTIRHSKDTPIRERRP